jgi:hypothetical protein
MSETNKGTAVAVAPQSIQVMPARGLPTHPEIEIMRVIATTVSKAAGMVPDWIKTEEQALAVMIAGHEMGLAPMTALRHVYIVNGRTDFDAQILMGMIKAGDPTADFAFERYDAEGCVVVLHRAGKRPLRVSYTKVDAEASGQLTPKTRKKYDSDAWEWDPVAKKNRIKRGARSTGIENVDGPWQLYPRDMYAWAAIKRAGRLGAPDVINGIPSHGVRELIDAPAKWVAAPDPMTALNPGDDGKVSPVMAAVAGGAVTADPDTGEIFEGPNATAGENNARNGPGYERYPDSPPAGQGADDDPDYVMPDQTDVGEGEGGALAIQDDSTATNEGEPAAPDVQETVVDRIRVLFDDFRATQETAVVQKLVMRMWAKWPETRGEDNNLHLELVKPESSIALRDWLADAQRNAGVPE